MDLKLVPRTRSMPRLVPRAAQSMEPGRRVRRRRYRRITSRAGTIPGSSVRRGDIHLHLTFDSLATVFLYGLRREQEGKTVGGEFSVCIKRPWKTEIRSPFGEKGQQVAHCKRSGFSKLEILSHNASHHGYGCHLALLAMPCENWD